MGYLAETIASLRNAHAGVSQAPAPELWNEDRRAEWLAAAPSSFADQRSLMLEAIRARLQPLVSHLPSGGLDRTLDAMARVPRERFICPWIEDLAYLPMAHDIGLDQIISHPELVAILAAAADPRGGRVLDVGTGSGYQAAVLAEMAQHVTSVEILEEHARLAQNRLSRLGYGHVEVLTGDAAVLDIFQPDSFDAIVVAAGAKAVPGDFLTSLKVGGRLIMPLGASQDEEHLFLVEKPSPGNLRYTPLRAARFVPLTGQAGRVVTVPTTPEE